VVVLLSRSQSISFGATIYFFLSDESVKVERSYQNSDNLT